MLFSFEQKQQLLDKLRRGAHREVKDLLRKVECESLVSWLGRYVRVHGLKQNFVFDGAIISRKYGYKLFSGEKRFVSRNQLLRVCLVMHMNREDVNHTLELAGMNPLNDSTQRDVLIGVGVDAGNLMATINGWLKSQGMEVLFEDSP